MAELRERRVNKPGAEADLQRIQIAQKPVPAQVFVKLIAFTAMMILAPIATYFYTLHNVFKENSTYAAITAVVVTNMVMVAYVVVAYLEPDQIAEKSTADEVKSK